MSTANGTTETRTAVNETQLRQCPRAYGQNGSVLISSVYCSVGCCPGTGDELWQCCTDPRLQKSEQMDWCTITLIVIITVLIMTFMIFGIWFMVAYIRRHLRTYYWHDSDDSAHRYSEYRPGVICSSPHYPRSSSQPWTAPYSPGANLYYPVLTPEQQMAVAQYWQALYLNYLSQESDRRRASTGHTMAVKNSTV